MALFCAHCGAPNLCLIACPSNQVLDQMPLPVCLPEATGTESDAEMPVVVEFADRSEEPKTRDAGSDSAPSPSRA